MVKNCNRERVCPRKVQSYYSVLGVFQKMNKLNASDTALRFVEEMGNILKKGSELPWAEALGFFGHLKQFTSASLQAAINPWPQEALM